jgi:asparagine synthase (glutamine-hydrolysing)
MCGITGIYTFKEPLDPNCIKRMTESLRHRGPDDEGFLAVDSTSGKVISLTGIDSKTYGPRIEDFNGSTNLFLGHRRLSIIDLSPVGHQPMSNEVGSLWIVHNGEIYNYLEIRKELVSLGHRFKSHTDTEVILHAYEEWGIECLRRFNGMWAFAIWDLKKKTLFCSRDRAGVKPFYYIYDSKQFCFTSEIKALLQIGTFSIEPNEQIIADYLFSGLIDHTQETFFKNIYQLRPGEFLLCDGNKLTIQSYWDIEPKEDSLSQHNGYADRFYELLEDSIRLRLRTDVPIGTCLSGGLDSSSIVCLANMLMSDGQNINSKLVGEKQKTFSSCFEEPAYDERKFIEEVISRTGAEKNYVFPDEKDFLNDLYQLIRYQDEPFGSTSMYAQWKVMRLAKERGVTVLLDGQGGDELLAGYLPSFYHLFRQARKDFDIGLLMREGKGFLKHHQNLMGRLFHKTIAAMFPKRLRAFFPGLDRNGDGGAEEGFRKNYYRSISWPRKFEHELNNYLYHAFRFTVLPGLLHYEDRNSMAFSLEARLPFLDYRLVEFSFSLPARLKMDGGVTKVVLREAMKGTLPERVRNRMDKIGFTTPEETWFRTGLREWIGKIISSKSFAERGYFNVPKVKQIFLEYCEGKRNDHFLIWRWVNLELWLRTFFDGKRWTEKVEGDHDIR